MVNREHIRAHLKNQFGLADEQIDSLLPSFVNTLAEYMGELEARFEAGNTEEVGRVAHTTKGALLNLGLHEQAELAKKIEVSARAGCELAEIEEELGNLSAALAPLLH